MQEKQNSNVNLVFKTPINYDDDAKRIEKLKFLDSKLENNPAQNISLTKVIKLAMFTTSTDDLDVVRTIQIINEYFRLKKIGLILEAIENGAVGKFGVTYKLTPQVITFWVVEHLRMKNA